MRYSENTDLTIWFKATRYIYISLPWSFPATFNPCLYCFLASAHLYYPVQILYPDVSIDIDITWKTYSVLKIEYSVVEI